MMNTSEEIQRCKEDIAYFYENYCLIDGKKPVLSGSDRAFLKQCAESRNNGYEVHILKGRTPMHLTLRKWLDMKDMGILWLDKESHPAD